MKLCDSRQRFDEFFRSGHPCDLPRGHVGNCRSCDGEWEPKDCAPVLPTLTLIQGGMK